MINDPFIEVDNRLKTLLENESSESYLFVLHNAIHTVHIPHLILEMLNVVYERLPVFLGVLSRTADITARKACFPRSAQREEQRRFIGALISNLKQTVKTEIHPHFEALKECNRLQSECKCLLKEYEVVIARRNRMKYEKEAWQPLTQAFRKYLKRWSKTRDDLYDFFSVLRAMLLPGVTHILAIEAEELLALQDQGVALDDIVEAFGHWSYEIINKFQKMQ